MNDNYETSMIIIPWSVASWSGRGPVYTRCTARSCMGFSLIQKCVLQLVLCQPKGTCLFQTHVRYFLHLDLPENEMVGLF